MQKLDYLWKKISKIQGFLKQSKIEWFSEATRTTTNEATIKQLCCSTFSSLREASVIKQDSHSNHAQQACKANQTTICSKEQSGNPKWPPKVDKRRDVMNQKM